MVVSSGAGVALNATLARGGHDGEWHATLEVLWHREAFARRYERGSGES